MKYQLGQAGIPIPEWLDDQGEQMSVNQFRQRAIQWMNLLRQGRLEEAQATADALQAQVSETGLPATGSGEEEESDLEIHGSATAAVPTPSAAEAACLQQAEQQAEQPPQVAGQPAPKTPLEELEEKVDELGDHVAKMKAKCDLTCPPLEEGGANSNSSSSSISLVEDTRKTKSKLPGSPKPMLKLVKWQKMPCL